MADATPTPSASSPNAPTQLVEGRPYQPLATLAVAALFVAGVFVLALLVIIGLSFFTKRAALSTNLLLVAVLGVVLSIAARAQIRRSEGTKTGLELASIAWWISVIGGGAYGGYYFANDLVIRQNAEKTGRDWIQLINEDKLTNAYYYSIEPLRRSGFNPDNPADFEGEDLSALTTNELIILAQRNPGALKVDSVSTKEWQQSSEGYKVVQVYRISCPEGTFDITLTLLGVESRKLRKREWMIATNPAAGAGIGFAPVQRSGYGRLIHELRQSDAPRTAYEWCSHVSGGQARAAYIATLPPEQRKTVNDIAQSQLLLGGATVSYAPFNIGDLTAERRGEIAGQALLAGSVSMAAQTRNLAIQELFQKNFFRRDATGLPLPPEKIEFLRQYWRNPSLDISRGAPGQPVGDIITRVWVKDNEVRATVAIDVQLSARSSAPARLNLVLRDPELTKEIIDLRSKGLAVPEASTLPLAARPDREWQVLSLDSPLEVPASPVPGKK